MTRPRRRRPRRPTYEQTMLARAWLVGLPGAALALVLLWTGPYSPKLQWTLTLVLLGVWSALSFSLRHRIVYPLQTFSNLLAALREGDYSIRARGARRGDAHGELVWELNALTATLKEQRFDAVEATTLLRKVMEEIDVAIFAFDEEERLCLVNRRGERLLARAAGQVIGRSARDLGLASCLGEAEPGVLDHAFPGESGRWEVRRTQFRQGGLPLQLLVLADVSRALRQEERLAWQRLIRVLSHELNNSLTPIQSIAGSLHSLLEREPRPEDWESDLESGLTVIAARSRSLGRFLDNYARLARLPAPRLEPLELDPLIRRVAGLETRRPVELAEGPACRIQADGDQIEQLLINLVRNAADAALETDGGVRLGWRRRDGAVEVWVEDEGPGLSSTGNLFVPFFSTKPGGSGIGLVLCRQIAEAHGGELFIENRRRGSGCVATLRLPA